MKKKLSLLLFLVILIVSCATLVACNNNNANDESSLAAGLSAQEYNYTYDRPFYSTPDDFMTIDGVFDEPEWNDCVWMQTTQYSVTYRITTLFTQKGLYVAAYAEDPNILYNGRNNFINNSSFEIQIVKTNEELHDSASRYNVHKMNDYTFNADAKTCRSYRERQFNGAVLCVGEPNSGETTSLSYEMFLGWDQMHYDESELNPITGIPDSVRIYCQYIMIDPNSSGDTKYISPFLMDYGKFYSYYEYGPHGIVNRPDNGVVGSAIGGTTSTDRWIMDNDVVGGDLKVDVNQTQHVWFTHDKDGNEVSRMTSFIADAQVTLDTASPHGQATFGIMTIHDMWSMVTYGVSLNTLANNNQVVLKSIEGIDSTVWVGQISQQYTQTDKYTDNTVCLRLVKSGGYYYYFYKHPDATEWTYVGYEFWYKNESEVDVGLFTNCPTTVSDYSVVNYTGKEDELNKILGGSVYFVETDASGGEISLSNTVLRHGETLTISLIPDNGRVLNSFTINGEDMFDEYVAANGKLVITPESDVQIEASFVRIPTQYLKDVEITVQDENGVSVANADYVFQSSNPLFVKSGSTNGKGAITGKLPIAGTFEINGKTYTCDGNYTLSLTKSTYLDTSYEFEFTENFSQTITMQNLLWGKKIAVNGKVPGNTAGSLNYDAENDSYYSLVQSVRQYYTNTLTTGGEYIYHAVVTTVPVISGTNIVPVPGIVIDSGSGYDTAINLKSAWWETNRLCIEINGKEISISNFKHSLNNNNADSKFEITVARYKDALYIYDSTNALVVILDENGVHPQGDRTIANKSGLSYIQTQLKAFFANGKENICGPLVYGATGGRVDYNITSTIQNVKEFIFGGAITVGDDNITCDTDKALDEYFAGETINIAVKSTNANKVVKSLLLTYDGGTKVIDGTYDIVNDVTNFSFTHNLGAITITVNEWADVATVAGTVSGVDDPTKVTIVFGGVVEQSYDGLVKADGSFSLKVPQGELGIAFVCGGKIALIDKQSATNLGNIAAELETNDNLVGNATVNGKNITSKGTLNYDTISGFAKGAYFVKSTIASAEFGSAERQEYAMLITNSATSNDFTMEANLSCNTWAYGNFGISITDGENILFVRFGAQTQNGTWGIRYGTWNEGASFDLNVGVKSGTQDIGVNAATFDNVKIKIVKTTDGITVFVGDNIQLCTVNNTDIGADFFAEGKEYCVAMTSQGISGQINHDITITISK